eukprot:CAMPEP_0167758448 /NCGR_PEP_ID=MMETSP0110_2-20121227/10472_1 /TAXON_ID=629695 /ORGANISM="Gymnochlora sp., Strain CCMP2014" /LENGTH=739 /DNA_ID=CAMNT_0007644721 /DNA_START=159 /DNA_END=2378 /DNA_ORIENTATION=+
MSPGKRAFNDGIGLGLSIETGSVPSQEGSPGLYSSGNYGKRSVEEVGFFLADDEEEDEIVGKLRIDDILGAIKTADASYKSPTTARVGQLRQKAIQIPSNYSRKELTRQMEEAASRKDFLRAHNLKLQLDSLGPAPEESDEDDCTDVASVSTERDERHRKMYHNPLPYETKVENPLSFGGGGMMNSSGRQISRNSRPAVTDKATIRRLRSEKTRLRNVLIGNLISVQRSKVLRKSFRHWNAVAKSIQVIEKKDNKLPSVKSNLPLIDAQKASTLLKSIGESPRASESALKRSVNKEALTKRRQEWMPDFKRGDLVLFQVTKLALHLHSASRNSSCIFHAGDFFIGLEDASNGNIYVYPTGFRIPPKIQQSSLRVVPIITKETQPSDDVISALQKLAKGLNRRAGTSPPPAHPVALDTFEITFQKTTVRGTTPMVVSECVVNGIVQVIPEWKFTEKSGWKVQRASINLFNSRHLVVPEITRKNNVFGNQPKLVAEAGQLIGRYELQGCLVEADPMDPASFIIYLAGRNRQLHLKSTAGKTSKEGKVKKKEESALFRLREPSGEDICHEWISKIATFCGDPARINVGNALRGMVEVIVKQIDNAGLMNDLQRMMTLQTILKEASRALSEAIDWDSSNAKKIARKKIAIKVKRVPVVKKIQRMSVSTALPTAVDFDLLSTKKAVVSPASCSPESSPSMKSVKNTVEASPKSVDTARVIVEVSASPQSAVTRPADSDLDEYIV